MKNQFCKIVFPICFLFFIQSLGAQTQPPRLDSIQAGVDRIFSAIDQRAHSFEERLDKATARYLGKLEKQEQKLKRKLWRKDSLLAKELFGDVHARYSQLRSDAGANRYSNVYSSRLDSLSTALSFLHQNSLPGNPDLQKALASLQDVQGRLNVSDRIKKQLTERQNLLKEQFQQLGMVKELKKFRQQVYYYQQQVKEYRELWENPEKLEEKLLQLVQKLPQFKEFFAKNSQLASLFALPGNSTPPAVLLAGLQTRNSIQQSLTDRFGAGPNVSQLLQQNVQSAQGQLDQLKSRAQILQEGSFGNTQEDIDLPDGFKPNTQKTKSFLQRMELGTNFQTQKARNYFPVTADLALTAGYKLNDKSIAGVGFSYKAGLGRGWNNISLSHQGFGLRSFIDYKLKGSLYISGGYEQNYLSQFNRVEQLRDYSAWQTSGLLGLSKKYKVSKKVKGEIKLLWDFLSYRQAPRTQALLFRTGWGL